MATSAGNARLAASNATTPQIAPNVTPPTSCQKITPASPAVTTAIHAAMRITAISVLSTTLKFRAFVRPVLLSAVPAKYQVKMKELMNISAQNAYWDTTWAGTIYAKLVPEDAHTAKMELRAKPVP